MQCTSDSMNNSCVKCCYRNDSTSFCGQSPTTIVVRSSESSASIMNILSGSPGLGWREDDPKYIIDLTYCSSHQTESKSPYFYYTTLFLLCRRVSQPFVRRNRRHQSAVLLAQMATAVSHQTIELTTRNPVFESNNISDTCYSETCRSNRETKMIPPFMVILTTGNSDRVQPGEESISKGILSRIGHLQSPVIVRCGHCV
ncbi:hypothetical protein TNIN_280951 [Trichonephila inaurata madagascariensis]|uniref:Uncharacterized protein n=1 Tax=Trichonephila inaurata madagascariensis TaxID=2747483 RepID=A0A8X6Y7V4_9ARAC|nr:hypothetical protein TNIN_280951 [Trichonephila inaurata madagascariensis]